MKLLRLCVLVAAGLVAPAESDDSAASGGLGATGEGPLGTGDGPFSPFNFQLSAAPGLDSWFKDAKLGMFMHWGPVSQWGTEISFPLLCSGFPCHPKGPNNTATTITTPTQLSAHRQAYADLAKTFDPVEFDATNMAKLAKAAGFKYLIYTTVHCDGFINWPSNLTDYNIANTPWGKKQRGTYSELVRAFRLEGLKVGAYVCPSLWNNDSYFPPSALTSFGPCCKPNYAPASDPARWSTFTSFLHGLVTELATLYQPDTFWFDCENSPPMTDTHLEAVLHTIRAANPDAVINIRNGMWSDYTESGDQSERLAQTIFGTPQEFVGDYFEIPAVMQQSKQWAYDPMSKQKPTAEFLSNLMMLCAKNGNYLMNVAPTPTGVWPPSALLTLHELADWFSINAEAIHGTRPVWPYQMIMRGSDVFLTGSASEQAIYVLIPAVAPDHAELAVSAPNPTGGRRGSGSSGDDGGRGEEAAAGQPSALHQALLSGEQKNLTLPWLRPSLFKAPLKKVELLGHSVAITSHAASDADGLVIDGIELKLPTPPKFNCKAFGCTCVGMGKYYGVQNGSFGCSPPAAQNWWQVVMNCTETAWSPPGLPHPGCDPGTLPPRVAPLELGLVIKLSF